MAAGNLAHGPIMTRMDGCFTAGQPQMCNCQGVVDYFCFPTDQDRELTPVLRLATLFFDMSLFQASF